MSVGKFIISLDFELMWGVKDVTTIAAYGENLKGVYEVIPRLLNIFESFKIKATFATVGLLFFESKTQLMAGLPNRVPHYADKSFSPYSGYLQTIGEHASEDPFHYAPALIRLIRQFPDHEIGSHTFSHYYCLEHGQTPDDFKSDILKAKEIALKSGIHLTSLVFPRNQYSDEYLRVCNELEILCFRGNESSWIYRARRGNKESLMRRGFRMADTYLNITGYNFYSDKQLKGSIPLNIPASKFLRPYFPLLKSIENMRLNRIKAAMTHAAKNGLLYHLWWHPHNFGLYQDENFAFLEKILHHYQKLNVEYGFESHTMTSAAKKILNSI